MQIDSTKYPKNIIDQYVIPVQQEIHFYVPLFTKRLKALGLTMAQIEGVNKAINETCNHCWDGSNSCQCWNDE